MLRGVRWVVGGGPSLLRREDGDWLDAQHIT